MKTRFGEGSYRKILINVCGRNDDTFFSIKQEAKYTLFHRFGSISEVNRPPICRNTDLNQHYVQFSVTFGELKSLTGHFAAKVVIFRDTS